MCKMVFGFLLFASVLAFLGYWAVDNFVMQTPPSIATGSPLTTITDFTFDDCGYTGTEPPYYINLHSNNHNYTDEIEYNGYKVNLKEAPDMQVVYDVLKRGQNRRYSLYTRSNPHLPQDLKMNDRDSIINSPFSAATNIIVVAHGWKEKYNLTSDEAMEQKIVSASLGNDDVNVIVVDWSRVASSNYVTAFLAVPSIGRDLGHFLRYLHKKTGANYTQMHLVGYGFGAHLVGNAGRILGGKVSRITALDPAGPLWNKNYYRIKKTDAVYVEGIHTDGDYRSMGSHGIGARVGHVDFYPNGGFSQPGCNESTIEIEYPGNFCSHLRSWELFAASVTYNDFQGYKCASDRQVLIDFCRGSALRMGNNYLKKSGTGMYRVNTGAVYPYFLNYNF